MSSWDKDAIAKYKSEKRNLINPEEPRKPLNKKKKRSKTPRPWKVIGPLPWGKRIEEIVWHSAPTKEHAEEWVRKHKWIQERGYRIEGPAQ